MMIYAEKNYIEVAEAAAILNVSPATVRRMFDAGTLTGFRLPGGEHRRIAVASLQAFLRSGDTPKPVDDSEA
jgi:excisionase family DNA binding protein